MKFQILSHAGLAVSGAGAQLICDPWLVGSTYWRSWWNYPPVSRALIDSLKPDYIYLTHVHWDHFQGPSLRKFSPDTPILIPKEPGGRMKTDLHQMGYRNTIELRHGQAFNLKPGFRITSYHFSVFLDSAAVIECDGAILLNANDAKFMGGPLKQILKNHPRIDFVFRSHSSANSRLCYESTDHASEVQDDDQRYLRDFANFVRLSGAKYAIPFASNHCFLHKDVFSFNDTVTTPLQVARYFERNEILSPQVKVMVSGDEWSPESGFRLAEEPYFTERQRFLDEYLLSKADILEKYYRTEAKATLSPNLVRKYFSRFMGALPWSARLAFKGTPIDYVLSAGDKTWTYRIDLYRKSVQELAEPVDTAAAIQIRTSAHIFRQCMALDLFSSLGISKRVRFRAVSAKMKYVRLLGLLFNLYEYDMLPLRRMFRPAFVRAWIPRWREIILYARLALDKAAGRRLSMDRYLAPAASPARAESQRTAEVHR